MGEESTLSLGAFERAMAILNREQETYLPSRREEAYFRWFNISLLVFIGLFVATIIGHGFDLHDEMVWLWGLQLLGVIAIVILFFANLGLVRKLWNQAKLRRRLGLHLSLKAQFKAQRREQRLSNLGTLLISILGYPLALFGLVSFVTTFLLAAIEREWETLFGSAGGFCFMVLGLSFIFLHFMRRGKQRLELVQGLRATLSKHQETFSHRSAESVSIDAEAYNQIARIERSHIITDRQRSITRGRKGANRSGYVIQRSHEMQAAKAALDPATAILVENQILQLTKTPLPEGSRKHREAESEFFRLRVPATDVEILYQVDEARHRIQVGKLQSSDLERSSEASSGEQG